MLKNTKTIMSVLLILCIIATSFPTFAADWCLTTSETSIDANYYTKCSIAIKCFNDVKVAADRLSTEQTKVNNAYNKLAATGVRVRDLVPVGASIAGLVLSAAGSSQPYTYLMFQPMFVYFCEDMIGNLAGIYTINNSQRLAKQELESALRSCKSAGIDLEKKRNLLKSHTSSNNCIMRSF